MKVHPLKLFFYKNAMLKRTFLLLALLVCVFNLNAQVEKHVKLGIETGFLLFTDADKLGLFIKVEPKVKISESSFVGVRFGVTLNPQIFENKERLTFYIDDESDNAAISIVPTFDYYLDDFYLKGRNFHPYLGLGFGYHLLSDIDVSRIAIVNFSEDVFEVRVNNRIGFLLRGGFEMGKLRFGLEYSLIPKGDIKIPDGQIIGTVENSYLGLSIGVVIGGGKSPALR